MRQVRKGKLISNIEGRSATISLEAWRNTVFNKFELVEPCDLVVDTLIANNVL